MWNAHNRRIRLEALCICALAIYFLHSTWPSVTWLISRSSRHWQWLTATDWSCQRYLSCRQLAYDVAEDLGKVSCTECTGQRNDFELIPRLKMETRHPIKGSFGKEFPSPMIFAELWKPEVARLWKKCTFRKKTTPYGKIFKILFQKDSSRHCSTCCVQISWNLADMKSVKSCVIYLILPASPALATAQIAPKSVRASSPW